MSGFLGSGLTFPIRPDRDGRMRYVDGEANIEQSLLVLLLTAQGERVMRPTFGTAARDLVFAPGAVANLRLVETGVREAIRDFEPRVILDAVTATLDPDDPTRAIVELDYRVRRTNTRNNLVFPYYLDTVAVP